MTQTMNKGGVMASSDETYMRGFCEFVRTLQRLHIPTQLIFTFPTPSVLIQIYITDCAIMRDKPNCWDTIRGKLRGIDYVAQCLNVYQAWAENPMLAGQVRYCKKMCKGKGSDTIPITIDKVRVIINYIICTKVINGLILTPVEQARIDHWLPFDRILSDKRRCNAYWYAMGLMTNVTLGLRGAEQYENTAKAYVGYGIQLRDITFMSRHPRTGQFLPYHSINTVTTDFDHVQIKLRHTKCGNVNEDIFVRIGRARGDVDPALIIYEMCRIIHTRFPVTFAQSVHDQSFLFSGIDRKWTLQSVKNVWHLDIHAMNQWLEPAKMRFHGLRKGFATALQKRSVPLGLIAYAGRWTLQAAIYRYILWEQEDLVGLADILWNKLVLNPYMSSVDMEASEVALIQSMPPSVHQYLSEYTQTRL